MTYSGRKTFTRFIPNIDTIPLSDEEACGLLNLSYTGFIEAISNGTIKRSVVVKYRINNSFSFLGILDVFEYALRRKLFFLNFGNHEEVNELVNSLIDEMVFIIDINLSAQGSTPIMVISEVVKNLEALCSDNVENWSKYWLLGGDRFSASICSRITYETWCQVFDSVMLTIDPLQEVYQLPQSQFSEAVC